MPKYWWKMRSFDWLDRFRSFFGKVLVFHRWLRIWKKISENPTKKTNFGIFVFFRLFGNSYPKWPIWSIYVPHSKEQNILHKIALSHFKPGWRKVLISNYFFTYVLRVFPVYTKYITKIGGTPPHTDGGHIFSDHGEILAGGRFFDSRNNGTSRFSIFILNKDIQAAKV